MAATKRKPASRKKAKPAPKPKPIWTLRRLIYLAAVVLVLTAVGVVMRQRAAFATPTTGPLSRQVNLYQQSIIKHNKPTPTLAALQYAYVASAYNDGLQAAGQPGALAAAQAILNVIYPDQMTETANQIHSLELVNHVTASPVAVQAIIDHYTQRYAADGHDMAWDGVIPTGQGKWIKLSVKDPLTPEAGNWQRWNVTQPISVAAPPVYGSAEDLKQIDIVTKVVAKRNGEDVNLINFWGGTPGTETPSGIWQNQLFKTVQADLPRDAVAADHQYSTVQVALAQSLSDAFMECWKVKYTYWTARPSMRIPGLVTAMDNPVFPGYISGHSTISKAAADTLSVLAPKYSSQWEDMADKARYSRLVAGIHFDVDNAEGYVVGAAVAQQTISALQLHQVID